MRRVALTGGIATGKSHVRAQLDKLGVATVDADALAREAVTPGTPALEAIVRRFGPGVLDGSRALDRRTLAATVFQDPGARLDLERIVHPVVQAATEAWFRSLDPARHAIAVAVIPLLFEAGRERDFEVIVVTACDPDTQLRRVMARDSLSEHEARQRLEAQLPTEDKVRRADHVITTDGTLEDTNRQVRAVFDRLVGG